MNQISDNHIDSERLVNFALQGRTAEVSNLSGDACKAIEQHLTRCPVCRTEYELLLKEDAKLQQYLDEALPVPGHGARKARNAITSWLPNVRATRPIAVTIAVVGVMLALFLLPRQESQVTGLLEGLKPPPYIPATLRRPGPESIAETHFRLGMKYYQTQEFDQAAQHLEKSIETDPFFDYALFYLGVSQLFANAPEPAIEHLEKLITIEKSILREKGLWYLTAAYLRAKRPQQAEETVQVLIRLNGDYRAHAEQLLKEIRVYE